MKKIRFKPSLARKIIEGYKKTTIRLENNFNVGDIVEVYSNNIKVCKIIIKKIEKKKLREISKEEILNEGFYSFDALYNFLKKVYKNLSKEDYVYIIHFDVLNN